MPRFITLNEISFYGQDRKPSVSGKITINADYIVSIEDKRKCLDTYSKHDYTRIWVDALSYYVEEAAEEILRKIERNSYSRIERIPC